MRVIKNKFVIIICFFCWLLLSAFSVPEKPSEKIYVNDFANVLSSDVEDEIYIESKKLDAATGAQVVVVTVNNLQGASIDEYSLALARKWGIGQANKSNGLLILLSVEDREIKVEVGTGLEGAINDSKAGRFIEQHAIQPFKENKWDEGVKNLYERIIREVYNEYGIIRDDGITIEDGNYATQESDRSLNNNQWILVGVVVILLIGIIFSKVFSMCGLYRGCFIIQHSLFCDRCGGGDGFGGGGYDGGGCGSGGYGGGSFGGGGFSGGGASRKF